MPSSVANIPLRFSTEDEASSIRCKLMKIDSPLIVGHLLVHDCSTVMTVISQRQTCPHCKTEIKQAVRGGSNPRPPKRTTCPAEDCRKDIAGEVDQTSFCEECKVFLEERDILDRVALGPNGEDGMFGFTTEESAAIDNLRATRAMIVRGELVSRYKLPPERLENVYQVVGENAGAGVQLRNLTKALFERQTSLLVHMGLRDEQQLTLKHERVGILMPNPSGGALVLVCLHGRSEIEVLPQFDLIVDGEDQYLDELGNVLQALPSIRDPEHLDLRDTRAKTALLTTVDAHRREGKTELPQFADTEGKLLALLGNLAKAAGVIEQNAKAAGVIEQNAKAAAKVQAIEAVASNEE